MGTLVLETLIVAIAVFGSALYPTGEVALQPCEIIPYTARHGLPALMGALLLGAVFAKVISTASNYLFLAGHESDRGCVCALHGAGSLEQAGADCVAAGGGAAGLLGALPGGVCARAFCRRCCGPTRSIRPR